MPPKPPPQPRSSPPPTWASDSPPQVCSGSIVGSGVGKKLAEVRWTTARKILYGWLLTLPAAALVGGIAAAVALTGTIGIIIVFAALLAGAGAIYAISKRSPVDSKNVNDSADVTINPEKAEASV